MGKSRHETDHTSHEIMFDFIPGEMERHWRIFSYLICVLRKSFYCVENGL